MEGRQAIGLALILVGLLIFIAALLGRTGATLAGLIFGSRVLKEGKKA